MVRSRLTVLPTSWLVCGVSVAGAGWASGAGSAGFRCAGREQGGRADVPKPAADPGRGEPVRCGGAFPGAAQVGDERAGEAELGVRGDDQPGPAVGRRRGRAGCGRVQPRVCLNSRKVCSRSKRRRNACHQRSTSAAVGVGGGGPQPDRLGVAVAGQMIDLQPDQGAFDDRQLARRGRASSRGGSAGDGPGPSWSRPPCRSGWCRCWWCAAGRARWRVGPGRSPGRACGGRPVVPAGRGGLGRRRTRSERSRPTNSTGRSART